MAEVNAVKPTEWGEREIAGPVHLFREGLLLRAFRGMLPDGRVLDAGCGSGSLALKLYRSGYEVEAVEQSEEFVSMVQQKAESMGSGANITVKSGSVTDLPFEDASFDGLVCGEVLEHVTPDLGGDEVAVAEFHRVLRPKGVCVVSVPLNPDLWDESDEWAGHVKRYTREGFMQLFVDAGFAVNGTKCWGFPLGRLYHRALFGPWLRRTGSLSSSEIDGKVAAKAARNRLLAGFVAGLLRFDELFSGSPRGRGIVLSAIKAGK